MPQFVVPPEGISFKDVITDFEKRLIESTLEAAGGVQKRAAELLHIKPTTLNEMIKRYDIRPRRKRSRRTATAASRPDGRRRTAPRRAAAPAARRPTGDVRRQVDADGYRAFLTFANMPLVLAQHDIPAVVAGGRSRGRCARARRAAARRAPAASGTRRTRRGPRSTGRRCCGRSARPAPRCGRWRESACRPTSLRAPAATGSRTARADDDGRGLERLQPLAIGQQAGEADERLLGQRHQLRRPSAPASRRRPPSRSSLKYSISSSQPLPGSIRPPYSTIGPYSRWRRRNTAPRASRCDGNSRPAPRRRRRRRRSAPSAAAPVVLVGGGRHPRVRLLLRQVDADADDLLEQRPLGELALDELPLALGEVADAPPGVLKTSLKISSRIAGSSCAVEHEDAACRGDLEAEHRRRVQIGEEHQHVVLLMVPPQVLDQRRDTTGPAASATPSRRRGCAGCCRSSPSSG